MQDIRHILFPVDLSQACISFAPGVRSIACRTGARVTLLSVFQLPPDYYSDPAAFSTLVDVPTLRRQQGATLDNFQKTQLGDLPKVHRAFHHGDPATVIVDYAREHDVDLIMMPTHGMGTLRRLLLGSVAAKVLHDTDRPVWTASRSAAPRPHPERLSRILCAVDLGEGSLAVLRYAERLAAMFGAQLRFVHVVPSSESFTVNYFDTEFVAALSDSAQLKFLDLANQAGVSAQVVIHHGEVAQAVRQEALGSEADLVVIGRGVLKETFGRLRTQAYGIIRESPCSVVSV